MKNNKILKRFLAFLLTAAMTLTYMPMAASWFAYAGDGDNDQVQLEQQVKAETSTGSEESSAAKGPSKEEVATDQTIESVEDAAESKESKTSEDTSEEVNGAASEKVEEASDKAKEEASDKAQEEAAEQVEETAEDEAAEAVAGELTAVEEGSYKITVKYDESAGIPEGADLKVKEIKGIGAKGYLKKTEEKLDQAVPYARFFDITIVDEEGSVIEPSNDVQVEIVLGDDPASEPAVKFSAVHFTDEKVDKIPVHVDESFEFTADSFSVYGIAYTYTVDFYYDALSNGNAVKYSMEGGSEMLLSELFAELGIKADVNEVKSVDAEGFEGVTVPFEQKVKISKKLLGSDWKITSLEPFDDWYKITVTMKNGEQYIITVTDPPASDTSRVNHIDIGINASASVTIPLAYGKYYDSEGNLVVEVKEGGEFVNATGVNTQIPITESDLRAAKITATKGGSAFTNFTAGTSYETSWGTLPNGNTIDQVRINGSYPTGTLHNPVTYSVEVNKNVKLTLTYNGTTLYKDDGDTVTADVNTALVASFTYFDDDNGCPGLPYNYNAEPNGNVQNWSNYMGGMDFILGTSSDTDTHVTAINIMKYIVDDQGQTIKTDKEYEFDFDVYQRIPSAAQLESAYKAPEAWAGETTATIDYSGYSKLNDRTVKTSTDGLGLVYDYDVADSALVYIVEDSSKIPQEIKDADGNTLKYQGTYIRTEYVWRTDGDQTKYHSNAEQREHRQVRTARSSR